MKTDICTFMISGSFLLRIRFFSDKNCRENQNTFLFNNSPPRKSCRLWDNAGKYGRVKTGHKLRYIVAHPHCMLAKSTHSECVILIAFPW